MRSTTESIPRLGHLQNPRRRGRRNPPLVTFGNPPKSARDWQCQECGTRLTLRQAERAVDSGCPKCGGVDIDQATAKPKTAEQQGFKIGGWYNNNPKRGSVMSRDVCEIRYKHGDDGQYYKHSFPKGQVHLLAASDTKVAFLRRVDGKPLIGDY